MKTNFFRYCCVVALLSFSFLTVSSILTVLGHFTRGHLFMVASSTYALAGEAETTNTHYHPGYDPLGLCLGSCLIMLVSAISDEFSSTVYVQV